MVRPAMEEVSGTDHSFYVSTHMQAIAPDMACNTARDMARNIARLAVCPETEPLSQLSRA
jgi:hypothetical protein